jgi:hypothetical protein
VPRSRISKLEVTRGRRSRWGIGVVIGAGAGLGVVASNPPSSADRFQVNGGAVAVSGAIGAASGALVGAVLRTDRWTTVPGGTMTLSIRPASGRGVALAMRVSFQKQGLEESISPVNLTRSGPATRTAALAGYPQWFDGPDGVARG